ncbi:MAG TPA: hypothetical protein VLF69_04175 [Candidatus Saccharimonadales bacterium]|nr:hypothetical protein [Candidatus Saccharimonadales bacterium]
MPDAAPPGFREELPEWLAARALALRPSRGDFTTFTERLDAFIASAELASITEGLEGEA